MGQALKGSGTPFSPNEPLMGQTELLGLCPSFHFFGNKELEVPGKSSCFLTILASASRDLYA